MSVLQVNNLLSEKERQQILVHLEELLESQAFAGSRRRQAFLRYVVEKTLAGRGHAVKETNIAVDVFGRNSDFDTQSTSIVRVTAAEVRKRLAQAYEGGLARELRIELPLGGYQPTFHFLPVEDAEEPLPEEPARQVRRFPATLIATVAACAVAAVCLFLILSLVRTQSSMDLLWRPFLKKDTPVLISLVAPTLLNLSNHDKWLPLQPGGVIPTSELQTMESTYVGTGGALGAALFAEQLASRGQRFVVKFGSDLAFADLKHSPAILLGTSRWTQELSRTLRFQMHSDGERVIVIDSQHPDRNWAAPRRNQSSQLSEGFSLVTRLLHSESGYPVLLVAGIDARDTQAAVEFLSRSDSFDLFARAAPRDWESKNFQVVLHNTIHGNSPGSLAVVALHVW